MEVLCLIALPFLAILLVTVMAGLFAVALDSLFCTVCVPLIVVAVALMLLIETRPWRHSQPAP